MNNGPTVIVVGGGVLGACAAGALAARGAKVTVLDAATPGSGTSAASFAWVNAQKKTPESYFRLNVAGIEEYHRLAEAGVARDWFHPVGNIEIATDPASSAAFDANVADLASRDYPAQRITAAEAAALEPLLDGATIADAAFFPREGWVDAELMIKQTLALVVADGGRIRPFTTVDRIERAGNGLAVILADGERLTADHVVCAAGMATQGLLERSGVHVPMIEESRTRPRGADDVRYPVVGGLADTSPLRTPLRRVLHTPDMGLRPTASGRAVLGGDGAGSRVPRTDYAVFDNGPRLLERAKKALPTFSDVRLDRIRVGLRPIPEDAHTVAGPTAALPALYVLATHSGITLAQYLARLTAIELLDGALHSALTDFRPDRFATGA